MLRSGDSISSVVGMPGATQNKTARHGSSQSKQCFVVSCESMPWQNASLQCKLLLINSLAVPLASHLEGLVPYFETPSHCLGFWF
jgi:hypothetical protein